MAFARPRFPSLFSKSMGFTCNQGLLCAPQRIAVSPFAALQQACKCCMVRLDEPGRALTPCEAAPASSV